MGIIPSHMAIMVTTAIYMAILTVAVTMVTMVTATAMATVMGTGATMEDMGMEATVLEDVAAIKYCQENQMVSKATVKKDDLNKRHRDLLEIARLVSWCINRDYLIKTCLDHISKRFGKRACCILLDGGETKSLCGVDKHDSPADHLPLCRERIVWDILGKGTPVNLTETHEPCNHEKTLTENTEIQAIIPLWYVDQLTQEERIVGALIIDSNGKEAPISTGDFYYLRLVAELIGGALGKIDLAEQLIEFHRRKSAIVKETAHAFRNRIEAIGGFSQRIARLAKDPGLAKEARILHREIQFLEDHLERFEKYIDI